MGLGMLGLRRSWTRPAQGETPAGGKGGASRGGFLPRRWLVPAIFAASVLLACAAWVGGRAAFAGGAPAGPAVTETATAVETAEYTCEEGCPGGSPPPRWRNNGNGNNKPDQKFSIKLETIVWWLLVANALQAACLVIMLIKFSSTGPTIDLSKLKLVGTVDKAS
jgi:hypothetical protein